MKILIIDDQRLFADGIRILLNDYDASITTDYAGNVFSAYDKIIASDSPNLILLNINTSATANSFDLINKLSSLHIEIPVMVISNNTTSTEAALAIENNASGFITKSCSRETTLKAIMTVLKGGMYVSKPTKDNDYGCVNAEQDTNKVTSRQKEVLYLLSQGLLNKQIADELDISANTVKAHLHDLFRRLDVSNRTAAVRHGFKHGLI